MGLTFAKAHELVTRPDQGIATFGLIREALNNLRAGKQILEGTPITMGSAELFKSKWEMYQCFAFRLVTTDPLVFHLSLASFTDGPLNLMDFATLFGAAYDFMNEWEPDPRHPDLETIVAPVEGALMICDPDAEDMAIGLEPVAIYPPNLNAFGFRWGLDKALRYGLHHGFSGPTP